MHALLCLAIQASKQQISEASGSSSTIALSAEPQVGPSHKDPAVKSLRILQKLTGQITHIDHKDGTSASYQSAESRVDEGWYQVSLVLDQVKA
jgi:hypothetical protein